MIFNLDELIHHYFEPWETNVCLCRTLIFTAIFTGVFMCLTYLPVFTSNIYRHVYLYFDVFVCIYHIYLCLPPILNPAWESNLRLC